MGHAATALDVRIVTMGDAMHFVFFFIQTKYMAAWQAIEWSR